VEDVVGRGATMVQHDQDIRLGELRLGAELALSAAWSVALSLPLRRFDTSIRYLDGAGSEVELSGPNIHHRNETLTGVGDPWLLGVWSTTWSEKTWAAAARAGASLPLGETVEDPFALGDLGLAHEHFQFGTGTVDPLLGGDVERRFAAGRLGVWVLSKQTLYENAHGYRAGARYMGGIYGESPLGTEAWSFRASAEVAGETAETWHGARREDEGNLGRVDVLVAAGARWSVGALALDATLRVPVYEHVIGGQIHVPVLFELGASWAFDAWGGGESGEEHHHHHDGDEHDEHADDAAATPVAAVEDADLDVLEYIRDGSAPELTPVAAKITVFDFWAPWCRPCRQLSGDLRELSMRYPGRFAVRMVNVVDWDSAAATRWLTPHGFSLPHLKVFDASGVLVYERSSSPEALIRDVEDLLGR